MEYEYFPVPEKLEVKDEYPDGANAATVVTVYRCFCGKGRLRYSRVPGFDDSWFELECSECNKKYNSHIDWYGYEIRVGLKSKE